jgi:hypothetical protein
MVESLSCLVQIKGRHLGPTSPNPIEAILEEAACALEPLVEVPLRFLQRLGRLELLRPLKRMAGRLVKRDAVADNIEEEVLLCSLSTPLGRSYSPACWR